VTASASAHAAALTKREEIPKAVRLFTSPNPLVFSSGQVSQSI
jgi:hypothetical protein